MKQKPPEFKDLKDLYSNYAVKRYSDLRERQNRHEGLYEQDENIIDMGLQGKDFKHPTFTPDGMLIVDDPADHLAMDRIVVDQPVKGNRKTGVETKQAKEQADTNGKWMQEFIEDNKRNEPYFYREIVHNQCYRGEALPKLDIHWDTIQDPEKYPGIPIEIVVPDSIMVYASLNLSYGVPEDVFWERIATVNHVMNKLDEWNEGKEVSLAIGSRKETDLVYFIEWYRGPWMGYLVADITQRTSRFWFDAVPFNGDIVTENPLGHPPFIRVYSGLGTTSRDGDPKYPARGILTGIESILIGKSKTYTKIDTITSKHALPLPVMDTVEGYNPTAEDLDFSAGAVKQTTSNTVKKIEYLMPPPIPDAILTQAAEQDRILENYRPAVTRGVPLPGEPASSLATRLGLAVLKWEPIKIAATKAVTRLCEMALEVVDVAGKKNIATGIEFGGINLTSEDVNGHYRAEVNIEPGNQEQLRFDIFTALQLWDKIPNPAWIIQKFLHEPNATQFLLDMHTEEARRELMQDPDYRIAFFAGVFELAGMKAEQARLKKMVEEGLLPGGKGMNPNGKQPQGIEGKPSATPPGAGGSPELGVSSLSGTHMPTVKVDTGE